MRYHHRQQTTHQTVSYRTLADSLHPCAPDIQQMCVIHTGRTGCHAGLAPKTAIKMKPGISADGFR